jgi:hypothetical protein
MYFNFMTNSSTTVVTISAAGGPGIQIAADANNQFLTSALQSLFHCGQFGHPHRCQCWLLRLSQHGPGDLDTALAAAHTHQHTQHLPSQHTRGAAAHAGQVVVSNRMLGYIKGLLHAPGPIATRRDHSVLFPKKVCCAIDLLWISRCCI